MSKQEEGKNIKVFEACPHCGKKLSPWQQVLLSVDRAIMCKNCWYRIILDIREEPDAKFTPDQETKQKDEDQK